MILYKKFLDLIARAARVLLMIFLGEIGVLLLMELYSRSFFNRTLPFYRNLCILLFLWITFLGVIILYNRDRLVSLELFYLQAPPALRRKFRLVEHAASLAFGILMTAACVQGILQYSHAGFSSYQLFSKIWKIVPVILAGLFITLKTLYLLLETRDSKESPDSQKKGEHSR